MKPEQAERLRKLLVFGACVFALTISVAFAVLYYRQYEHMNSSDLESCVAKKVNSFGNVTARVDVS